MRSRFGRSKNAQAVSPKFIHDARGQRLFWPYHCQPDLFLRGPSPQLVNVSDVDVLQPPIERRTAIAITTEQRHALLQNSLVAGVYEKAHDRESAYEKLQGRVRAGAAAAQTQTGGAAAGQTDSGGIMGGLKDVLFGTTGPRGGVHDGLAQSMAKSAVRTIGSTVGREIIRGVLGSLFGKKR